MLFRSRSRIFTLALMALAVILTSGCLSKKPKGERRLALGGSGSGVSGLAPGEWGPGGAPGEGAFGPGGSMSGAGFDGTYDSATNSLANTASLSGVADGSFVSELQMIHFEFDSYDITPDWQGVLDGHAQWINQHSSVMVQVEGHCDERGTEEYNVSLGQRRADAVRNYLVNRGVDPNRLSTISYGKMRPLSFDTNEQAHALNRRAMFLVYEVQNSVAQAGY